MKVLLAHLREKLNKKKRNSEIEHEPCDCSVHCSTIVLRLTLTLTPHSGLHGSESVKSYVFSSLFGND